MVPPVKITRGPDQVLKSYSGLSNEAVLREVQLGLQGLLKKEYGETALSLKDPAKIAAIMELRNPRLAGLTPAEALQNLRDELRAFASGVEPFNRRFRTGETVYQKSGSCFENFLAHGEFHG